MIHTIKIDATTSVQVETRATGQVKLAVAVPFLGYHHINVTPDQAQALADALYRCAELAAKVSA